MSPVVILQNTFPARPTHGLDINASLGLGPLFDNRQVANPICHILAGAKYQATFPAFRVII